MLTLILGGARSGKSRYAEQLASQSGHKIIYIATAVAGDDEMQARIKRHQLDRPDHWPTIEEPVNLAQVLSQESAPGKCLLVECLTLWLNNIMLVHDEESPQPRFEHRIKKLLDTLPELPGDVILVSNEIGMGVVPMGNISRSFVDETGRLHQKLAKICDCVTLMIAGLPQKLK